MKNLNYKHKLLKHSYLKEEANHMSETFSHYLSEFLKDCPQYADFINNLEEPEDETEEEEKEVNKKDLKQLYRRISKMTHPDKTSSSYLESIFKQSSEDYRQNKIGSLFSTAVKLNIEVSDLSIEHILDEMELEITTYEEAIENFKSSAVWKWANAQTDEEREVIKKQIDLIVGEKR
jgi:hypothetical protein